MRSSILVSLYALFSTTFAAPSTGRCQAAASCNSVQIFVVRGSNEPYPGRQGALTTAICQGIPNCGYTDVVYPATIIDYCNSAHTGVTNGKRLVTEYATRCPETKLVLTGYSQGAHIVGDILGGGGGKCILGGSQPISSGLDRSAVPGKNVVAALLFGDVRHTAGQPYNTGTGVSKDGMLPREGAQLKSLYEYSSVLRAWCNVEDPICAGGNSEAAHHNYFDVFTQEAAAWVKSKI